jgi:tetratricopeptide repeat protein 21B
MRELKHRPGDIRPKLLENMALVATKNKSNVEKAISSFMEIASQEVSVFEFLLICSYSKSSAN